MSFIRPIVTLAYNALSYFSPKKYISSLTPPSQPIDETAAIASVREYLSRLGYLATSYGAQLRAVDITRELSMITRLEGREAHKSYDKLRCAMLMEFARWNNQLLDRGLPSAHWNMLRDDVIATPSGILIHAMSTR